MRILAIETSCDETAIAVLEARGGFADPMFEIFSNIVSSQVKLHAKWGGVVPSLAKREHQANLVSILKRTLKQSNLLISNSKFSTSKQFLNSKFQKLKITLNKEPELLSQFLKFIPTIKPPKIDAIAVTVGPGLEPALWVGINFARALSLAWDKPIIPVNHMEGHIVASLLNSKLKNQSSKFQFPTLALLVSGGHTQLVLIKDWLKYKIIGQTRDDAVGEAFDKVARMLKLPYPGGPEISKLAEESTPGVDSIKLPRPMMYTKDFDFSFSGLKTAVLYLVKNLEAENHFLDEATIANIAAEFQQAVIDVLVRKTVKAAEKYKVSTIILGGGVAANKELRKQLKIAIGKLKPKPGYLVANPSFCGDNAAMIAAAAYFQTLRHRVSKRKKPRKLKAQGNLKLT